MITATATRIPRSALAIVFLLIAPPLFAYNAVTSGNFSVDVQVSGAKEINVFPMPWKHAAYQSKGVVTIDIIASYTPDSNESFTGSVPLAVGDSGGQLTFAQSSGYGYTSASATIDLASLNTTYLQFDLSGVAYKDSWIGDSAGFYTTIILYKERAMAMPSGDASGNLWTIGNSPITVWLYDVKVTAASNYYASTYQTVPVTGETITPQVTSFIASPASATTDENGAAAFNFIPTMTGQSDVMAASSIDPQQERKAKTLDWFPSPCTATPLPSEQVTFQTGSGEKVPRKVIVPYARILDMGGDVRVQGALGGGYVTAQSGCNLGKGDTVFLGPMDPQTYQDSWVVINFFNMSTGEVDGSFTKQGTNLLIRLGDSVEIQEYTMLNDVRNLAYDVYANPVEWGKTAIQTGIGKGVEWAFGGYGWIASKLGGSAVKYGMRKMDDWANAPQQIRFQSKGVTGPRAVPMDSRAAAKMAPAFAWGASLYSVYHGDGTTDIINRGEPMIISDGTTSVIVPPWSTAVLNLRDAGSPAPAAPMILSPFLTRPQLTITPADGSSVTTLQPKIVFDYPGASSTPIMPSTFVARLNGYLISPGMQVGALKTSWYPPSDRPLVRGSNLVTASVMTTEGATSLGFSRFSASAPLPAPSAPRLYPGRTAIVVQWDALRDSEIVGYKVFRSATSGGTPVEISSGVLTQPVFADTTPLVGGPGYYQIAGVTGSGTLTSFSPETAGALSARASQLAPAAVSGLVATAGDNRVTVAFSDPSARAVAYRIERQSGGGSFVNAVSNGGLVAASPFVDRTAGNWQPYVYRVTPLAADLIAGPSSDTLQVTPQDLPPAAPQGVTALADVGNNVFVEWNPSPEPDLLGYYVERARPGSGWLRITGVLTNANYSDLGPGTGLFGYRIIAVDQTGHEGAPSAVASTFIRDSAGLVPPSDFGARAVSSTQVNLSWSAVAGATAYQVDRMDAGGSFVTIATSPVNSYSDGSVLPDRAYLYRVRASDGMNTSGDSAPDLATTVGFTDSPLTAGTIVKAVHLAELRKAVDAVSSLAALPQTAWTDSSLAGITIKAVHLTEMRTALKQARTALGLSGITFTDATPAGIVLKAVHLEELRTGVR